jgi:putative ABC transport system permease protein
MADLKLALRLLMRDWRAGELRILAIALVVAVASVTSVGFFADRVRQALVRDAHQLLGADLVLIADQPWKADAGVDLRGEIRKRGLAFAETASFISMARFGEAAQLTGIKAVSDGYPLRGKLRIANGLNEPDHVTDVVPLPGAAWIDERLASALSLRIGDPVEVGRLKLTVGAILTLEPDRSASFFNFAPRLIMHVADLADSGLIGTGSRVTYSLLAAGEPEKIGEFERWVKPKLGRGQTLQSLTNARPEIRNTLERSQQFVGLTALLAVILAAVAVSLAARRYGIRHQDAYAVMRCFGATSGRLLRLSTLEFMVLGLVASAVGCLIGFAAQFVIAGFVTEFIGAKLPVPTPLPALQGFLTGLALLLGFALPPLLQLRHVPALRVLRSDIGLPQQAALVAWGMGLAAIAALLVWQAGDARMGFVVLGGFAAAFALFGVLGYAALRLIGGAAAGVNGAGRRGLWRYGIANLRRHARTGTVQVVALALGLTAVLLLTFTRNDLLATWKSTVPPDAPNRFIVNIQPDQKQPLLDLFAVQKLDAPAVYPMIRGRLTALNGSPIRTEDFEERDRRMADREFNLSHMKDLPGSNEVVEGRWFAGPSKAGEFSVEEGIARRLGWKLGDTLTWQVGGRDYSAPITSIRRLNWDSMRVNFFVIASPGLMDDAPTSFITSFHLPEARAAFSNEVSKRFTNLTVIDMSTIVKQAQRVIDQVVSAVQFVFLFALGAGILVLYSALLATQDERQKESALIRSLGATRAQILSAQRAEFAVLGVLAGLLAAAGATAIGWSIAQFVLKFPYTVNHWVWIAGPALGLLCVAINAWAGARAVLGQPPLLVLRES